MKDMEQKIYESFVKILKKELVPALGCTEPIALAYAAAKARQVRAHAGENHGVLQRKHY